MIRTSSGVLIVTPGCQSSYKKNIIPYSRFDAF
jgi:hypothetical protein